MTIESVSCALCGGSVPLDGDHVDVEAEMKHMNDRNEIEEWALHVECWRRLSDGWAEPA